MPSQRPTFEVAGRLAESTRKRLTRRLGPNTNLGTYRIVGEAGQGGMASICAKRTKSPSPRYVAIKVLPDPRSGALRTHAPSRRKSSTTAWTSRPTGLPWVGSAAISPSCQMGWLEVSGM